MIIKHSRIHFILYHFLILYYLLYFIRALNEEKSILEEIRKCTKSIRKSSVEHTATMMAWSDKNQLNVDKYREKVNKDLDGNDDGHTGVDDKGL